MKKWYAKSKRPGSKQVEVKEHLCAVGELSKEYGRQLGMEKEAEMAGTVHDAGKLTDKFQDVLEGKSRPCKGERCVFVVAAYQNE